MVKGADFSKGLYNRRSVLPFSKETAEKFGMIFKNNSVFIIWDLMNPRLPEFKAYLESMGMEVSLAQTDHPSLSLESLSDYNVIIFFNGTNYSSDLPANTQNAIMQVVRAGGTFIATQWMAYMVDSQNTLQGLRDVILFRYQSQLDNETVRVMPGQENHPVLKDLSAEVILPGTLGLGELHPFTTNPAVSLMQSGRFCGVAARKVGNGRAVMLAIAPTRSPDSLQDPSIRKLLVNAILWEH